MGNSALSLVLIPALLGAAAALACQGSLPTVEPTQVPTPAPTVAHAILRGDGVRLGAEAGPAPGDGTYRLEKLRLPAPAALMRVMGHLSLISGEARDLLVTDYLETYCRPPLADPLRCSPAPEHVVAQFALPQSDTGWWVGEYVIATTGETWVWEAENPKTEGVPLGFGRTDLYVFVAPRAGEPLTTSVKFENISVSYGETVLLPHLQLSVAPPDSPTKWVLYPAR